MSLDGIMNLEITVESRAPSQEGFGTPLLFGYTTAFLDGRVREYATADEMLDDGFDPDDALYNAAKIVKSQNPCPTTFKVGRRVTPLTQVVTLTPKVATAGYKYKGTVGGKAVSYTVLGSATTATVATALAALLTTLGVGGAAVAAGSDITFTATTPGAVVGFDFTSDEKSLEIKDATIDTTTDDELAVVNDEDSDWYGLLVVDSQSKATILNVASWTETQRKIATVQTADSEVLDPTVLDDVLSSLMDSSYARTNGIYHRAIGGVEWLAVGWQAGRLTSQPGSDTWAFKVVAGVKVDKLLTSQQNAIEKKNGSYYTREAGLPTTFEGHSGSGEYMDTIRFIDWVFARMRERVMGVLANNPKVPFTDTGVDVMRSAIMSVIQQGITAGGFAPTPEPTVTAPLVKNVDPALRIKRTLPDVSWTAQLAGAIHRMTPVRGRVSV
jgi:hypothetical protein